MDEYRYELNFDHLATGEIRDELKQEVEDDKKKVVVEEKLDLTELLPMDSVAIQKHVLSGKTTEDVLCKLLMMKCFQQHADPLFLQILEIHGLIRFKEHFLLRKLLAECHVQHGETFINRLVRYIAAFCYEQNKDVEMQLWKQLFFIKPEINWPKVFASLTTDNNHEKHLVTTLIMLFPEKTPPNAARAFALMAKSPELPNCFRIFCTTCFNNMSAGLRQTLNKDDVETMVGRFLRMVYDECFPLTPRNDDLPKNEITQAQSKFTTATFSIVGEALNIIRTAEKKAAYEFLKNPSIVMDRPSNLFIEFILQFAKLGMFTRFDNKLMAWNYYYDDRWCGYDRQDLFGTEPYELSEMHIYKASFKYAGRIRQHSHHRNLMLFARAIDWMLDDDQLQERLIEKYGDEEFVQYGAIALSFAGMFEKMQKFYQATKDRVKTKHAYMSLNTCYLYSLAKQGIAIEAIITWSRIMDDAIFWGFSESVDFDELDFELPQYVKTKFTSQFATRLLRNCLWTAALKEGSHGWEKFGLFILYLCETLEDSFLNHNMVRIMFQKVDTEDLICFFQMGFEYCTTRPDTYNYIISTVNRRDPNLFPLLEKCRISLPGPDKPVKTRLDGKPEYVTIHDKLKWDDPIFMKFSHELPIAVYEWHHCPDTPPGSPPPGPPPNLDLIPHYYRTETAEEAAEAEAAFKYLLNNKGESPDEFFARMRREEGGDEEPLAEEKHEEEEGQEKEGGEEDQEDEESEDDEDEEEEEDEDEEDAQDAQDENQDTNENHHKDEAEFNFDLDFNIDYKFEYDPDNILGTADKSAKFFHSDDESDSDSEFEFITEEEAAQDYLDNRPAFEPLPPCDLSNISAAERKDRLNKIFEHVELNQKYKEQYEKEQEENMEKIRKKYAVMDEDKDEDKDDEGPYVPKPYVASYGPMERVSMSEPDRHYSSNLYNIEEDVYTPVTPVKKKSAEEKSPMKVGMQYVAAKYEPIDVTQIHQEEMIQQEIPQPVTYQPEIHQPEIHHPEINQPQVNQTKNAFDDEDDDDVVVPRRKKRRVEEDSDADTDGENEYDEQPKRQRYSDGSTFKYYSEEQESQPSEDQDPNDAEYDPETPEFDGVTIKQEVIDDYE